MRLSYTILLSGVITFMFFACKKKENPIVPQAQTPPIDSAQTPAPVTYPYTDRYSGVLTKYINGKRTDSDYVFYVTYQSEDTIIFISSGAIAEGKYLPHRRFNMKYPVSNTGIYYFDNYYVIGVGEDPHQQADPGAIVFSKNYLKITWQDFYFEDLGVDGNKPVVPVGGVHSTTCKGTYYGEISPIF